MKLDQLIDELRPVSTRGKTGVEVKGVSADSRLIKPGDLFVAVAGKYRTGVDFISEAKDRGAVGVVLTEFYTALNSGLAQIRVTDPRRALALLANSIYHHPAEGMKMIGITGTNGKTTVAILARHVFNDAGIPTGLLGTIYYGIGERQLPSDLTTPAPPRLQELLAEMKKAGTARVIMEVSSHAIIQQRLAGIEFATVVFTNLSPEHLDYHRTMEEYRAAKVGFLAGLSRGKAPADGKTAIINSDDPLRERIYKKLRTPVITYGLTFGAQIRASGVVSERTGASFTVYWGGKAYPARIAMPGKHNVYNALAVIALGLSEGIGMEMILDTLRRSPGVRGRLEPVRTGRGFDLFIDYAHTPDGLENVLKTLRSICRKRVIVVFGCGGDRDESKRPLMGAAAARWADEVIVTSDNPRSESPQDIITAIQRGLPRGFSRSRAVPDRRRAIEEACRLARPGDTVLIAGKGHEQQQIFRDRVIPFDDREVALEILGGM
ncbi:MAG: UDP-N-acetylmuramoyl-L-alanyl-D-glutamate--2,6-diaminopimelate ligase [PVC group bacterium]